MLEYCPRECLAYVIVHELAHLRENNHSARFWAVVAGALPDYRARQAGLRAFQWVLGIGAGSQRAKIDKQAGDSVHVTVVERGQ